VFLIKPDQTLQMCILGQFSVQQELLKVSDQQKWFVV